MKLQTRIFLLVAVSLVLSLVVSVSISLSLLENQNELFENTAVRRSLDDAFDAYGDEALSAAARLDRIGTELETISRESSRFRILRQDLFLKAGRALTAFCAFQLLLLGFLAFVLSRALARPWRRIHDGLRRLETGDSGFRFKGFRTGDFGRLSEHLNRLLDTVKENEDRLREQANLLGWKEAASFLAHQFRNPLAAVSLSGRNLSLLMDSEPPDRDLVKENLRILEEETSRLSSLMTRLRELTSFEKLETALHRLDELFIDAARRYSPSTVAIRFSGRSGSPLPFDRQYMEQLFFNLVNNSIEACIERGLPPEVSVTFASKPGEETAEFEDNVTGLSQSVLEKIGTPRYTTKKTGSGLGIHIMKKIVSLHGGTLRTGLNGAGGLVFSLNFPRRSTDGEHTDHRR